MGHVTSEQDYLAQLEQRALLPAGFAAATTQLQFVPTERPTKEPYLMNLSLLLADQPCSAFAAVFTRNAMPGAPVIVGRRRLAGTQLRGIVVNNRIANVCSATGEADIATLTTALAHEVGCEPTDLLSVSTGIIGWSLPVADMVRVMPNLVHGLPSGSVLDVARRIMTTDSYPKVRRAAIGTGSIVAVAKGAGMIEPNMATMLVFVLTDIAIDRPTLQAMLARVVHTTFNRISVDSDQSTSDMCVAMSSARCPGVDEQQFESALHAVCAALAEDIVRNGEGTSHVMRVTVAGVDDESTACAFAKAVVNSPLVKTAVYGNDPNVGRIVSALGDFAGNAGLSIDRRRLTITMGDRTVFDDGAFRLDKDKEQYLSAYMAECALNPRIKGFPQHDRCVEIGIDFRSGPAMARVFGSDLSDEYVHENADYRS